MVSVRANPQSAVARVTQLFLILGVLLGACSGFVKAEDEGDHTIGSEPRITSLDIVGAVGEAILAGECIDYCVVGVCITWTCTLSGCMVDVGLKLDHRYPDLIVMTWDERGNPWEEFELLRGLVDTSSTSGGVGGGSRRRPSPYSFSEAGVVGNFLNLIDLPLLCTTEITPLLPYYLSTVDSFRWRGGGIPTLIERLFGHTSEVQVTNEDETINWGHIYPIKGFFNSGLAQGAGNGLLAQRVMEIATEGGLALVLKIPRSFERERPKLAERVAEECWQRVFPSLAEDEPKCVALRPTADLVTEIPASPLGGYVWLFWSRYKCCTGKYFNEIDIDFPEKICL